MVFGFIGVGNMGGALAQAARRRLDGDRIVLSSHNPGKAGYLARKLEARTADNAAVAGEADYLFLGVKPLMMETVLAEIAPVLAGREGRFVRVSMAAGLSIADIRRMAGGEYPVIRIMPNMPVGIGQGAVLYTLGPGVTEEEKTAFLDAMGEAGEFTAVPERLIDAGSAVAGCGPAFAALFIEALADGGVACGLPRAQAQALAAQMAAGTARMVLDTGVHPAVLKDAVCSPGGTTIQGVRALERGGFRSAVMEAVIAACEKNKDLVLR